MMDLDRLPRLRDLLKVEHDEDLKQYRAYFSRDNINYRKQHGVTWYPVVIRNEELGMGDYLSIELERSSNLNEPHQFSGGKPAALFSNNFPDAAPLQGIVKLLGPNKLKLTLNVDELPDWCDSGKLGLNLLFDENSYKEMDLALERTIYAKGNRLAELRDVLYGLRPPQFDDSVKAAFNNRLNEHQNEAVQKICCAKDIALVHGPPGTGKTTTLVQAILEVLKTEKQVLVCSSSNTAVDLMTEKLHREQVSVLRLGNPARISEEVLMNTLDAKVANHPSYKELKNYRKTAEEYFRMAGKYKRSFGREEREQRQLLYQEGRKLLSDARLLEDYITHEQFSDARVIACTPIGATSKFMRDKQFSTLFMDEAAQALEPMCWIPISKCKRVIFAGDHFQLPPTVKSKVAEKGGLMETIFERCMNYEGVSVMLRKQYRMHAAIMGFSNQHFYGNNLIADQSVKERLLPLNEKEDPLIAPFTFIDTAGCGFEEKLNPESLSISNPEEAELLIKHLQLLLQAYVDSGNSKTLTIGIISPYKEQVIYLNELIQSSGVLSEFPATLVVKTVDGFQGQERDVIYISLVRCNEKGEIGFLADVRRMNVALTRAKQKLVVIGDSATLALNPFYAAFMNYAEELGAHHSAWEFRVN